MRAGFDNKYDEDMLIDDLNDRELRAKAKRRRKVIKVRRMRRKKKLRKMLALVAAVLIAVVGVATAVLEIEKRNSSIQENDAYNLAVAAGDDVPGTYGESEGQVNGDGSTESDDVSHEDVGKESLPETTADSSQNTSKPTERQTKPSVNGIYTVIDKSDINSQYAVLYDCNKKITLAGYNEHQKMYPASMTKILTLIVAVENIKDLSRTYALTQAQIDVLYKRGASRVGLERNKPVSAEDCLYGLILPSGADAALALACMAAGSEEKFADMMNAKCKELGLTSSHFTNSTGLHDPNQYTTVYEMCKIMEYAMNNPVCAKVLNTVNYTMKATSKTSPNGIPLTNNALQKLKKSAVEGITIMGAKTGFTNEAMYCMASCAVKNGTRYIVVTAKADSSNNYIKDAYKLYTDYCR